MRKHELKNPKEKFRMCDMAKFPRKSQKVVKDSVCVLENYF